MSVRHLQTDVVFWLTAVQPLVHSWILCGLLTQTSQQKGRQPLLLDHDVGRAHLRMEDPRIEALFSVHPNGLSSTLLLTSYPNAPPRITAWCSLPWGNVLPSVFPALKKVNHNEKGVFTSRIDDDSTVQLSEEPCSKWRESHSGWGVCRKPAHPKQSL